MKINPFPPSGGILVGSLAQAGGPFWVKGEIMKRNQAKIRNLSRDELWDVANSLSLVDMTALINMFSRDISVNVGTLGGCGIEVDLYDSEVVTATLNGHSILIDSHMCGLDDMMEDEYFSQAVYKYFISIGVPDEEMKNLICYHQRAIAKTKSKE